ncbi:transporter substrate-binding domain-containing protein [Azospirillum melinis]|uniref:Transporter substrate-binding domain-containing protein n=1 Tax=Azospirillum melinis TaxID=328839 RepID=A0ABX2K3W4_9PROT|nr:transporter substrate-binding domain-containing protein [Azospirillum melinis]MBP2306380.1 polar amino acid transport system substrate-binding protein [Azospirillum melinis]NUA98262.1 transporter substrate-binding domain-containing protein [Azospirillum melinis]
MKRLVTGVAALLLLASGGVAAAQEIRIATEGAYPPFNVTQPDGKVAGLEVDLANALCERMKRPCTVVAQEWDGIIPGLLAKKYDAIMATMNITPERAKAIGFSTPYMVVPAYFVAPASSAIDGSPASLRGKTIGAQVSTTHSRYVEKHLGSDATLKTYDTASNLLADLKAGRLDAAITTGATASDWVKGDGGKSVKLVGQPVIDAEVFGPGIGVGLRKEDSALKQSFDEAIRAVVQDGTLARIAARYVDFSITP